jgi:teichuronic acid biosynthesis glycosyltransferase TuaC
MKILTFTTLFPNTVKPHHGIFTETTLKHLLATGQIKATVVAPVPWFPSKQPVFGKYATFAQIPLEEQRIGVRVLHPRYFLPPKVGMNLAPWLIAQSAIPTIERLIASGDDFDVIDAHYFYPDGVAAALVAKHFGKSLVISALGTDINLIPKFYLPRKMMLWASRRASGMAAVCEALRAEMMRMGMDGSKIVTLRNGVDLELFRPVDRTKVRADLGMNGFTIVSVGYLDPRKGHDRTIAALPLLPDVNLIIIGGGPERGRLADQAVKLGVANRVKFQNPLPQDKLRDYYGACDASVLASSREGWANVLLESMACGTPVVASNIWGTPEVITSQSAGVLMHSNTPEGIVDAVKELRANAPDRASTRKFAERFSWDDTTQGQIDLFERAKTHYSSALAVHA